MAKTLLRVTQDILNKMDGDEVNHISDSIESEQVADCVRSIYDQIISEYDLPVKRKLFRLDNTDDNTMGKTRLFLPANVQTLESLAYNVVVGGGVAQYRKMPIIPNEDFLITQTRLSSGTNVEEQTYYNTTMKFNIYNNRPPQCATLVEDKVLIFDSYDQDEEFNLQNSKTMCFGIISTEMILDDGFVIDLPYELLNLVETNATELAFDLYKGGAPMKITDLARKARVRQQRSKNKMRNRDRTGPDYGRKGGYIKTGSDDVGVTGTAKPLPDYLK